MSPLLNTASLSDSETGAGQKRDGDEERGGEGEAEADFTSERADDSDAEAEAEEEEEEEVVVGKKRKALADKYDPKKARRRRIRDYYDQGAHSASFIACFHIAEVL